MAHIGAGEELRGEVADAHGVEAVARRPVEAERRGRHVAVDREAGAGERRAPSGLSFIRRAAVAQAGEVARQHLDIGQQVVAEGDGLGRSADG